MFSLRDKLASHVEKTMRQVAPNVTEIAGATIGARLIARSGGLKKLAVLPASTIQILGAEKALYRALKSGARPPKHGILFQHAAVHSAPKWQRGKVARSVAGKIAIAARIDIFRGSKDENILHSLEARLDEIKVRYKDAPKEERQFTPGRDLIIAETAAGDVTIGSTDAAEATGLRESAAMNVDDNSAAAKLFEGVFQVPDPRNPNKRILATKNLSAGRSFYGEALVKRRLDGETAEFRSWDPFRSKLSAAVLNRLKHFPFSQGTYCLYLGASTGTTVSHLSDIVGNSGRIFAVEMAARVAREFLENVVKYRKNIVPIVEDAKHPERTLPSTERSLWFIQM